MFKQFSYGSDEYKASLQLREQVLRVPLGLTLSEQDVVLEDQQLHFGMFEQQQLVACVVFRPINSDLVKLRQMTVSPSQQGKGIGRTMLEQAEREVRKLGFNEIDMAARVSAIDFYLKLGYQTAGEEFEHAGIPHIKMYKILTN